MSLTGAAAYDAWRDLYETVYRDASTLRGLACPTCGADALQVTFIVREQGDIRGAAAFWCAKCLEGIYLALVPILPRHGAVLHAEALVPDFRLVPRPD